MRTSLSKNILIATVLVMFAACNSNQEKKSDVPENAISPAVVNNPVTASSDSATTGDNLPVFQFTEETHDFGTITQGEKISYAFRFKNVGKGDLLIRAANGSCGCTVAEYPKEPIAPGKEGTINITFDSAGKEDMEDKNITLIANTIPNTKVLTITGKILLPKNQ